MPSTTTVDGCALLFVRHGESEANVAGVIAGFADSPLTQNGARQAETAAALLAGRGITRVYSSPLRRAADTARRIARACQARVELVDALRERSFGVLEGRPVQGVVDHFSVCPTGGERWQQFADRVACALARLPRRGAVVVAHAGVYRVLLERVCGQRFSGRPANACLVMFDTAAMLPCQPLDTALWPSVAPGHTPAKRKQL